MPHTKKYSSSSTAAKKIVAIQSGRVGNYENDAFFVQKTQTAMAKLRSSVIPAALSKKSK